MSSKSDAWIVWSGNRKVMHVRGDLCTSEAEAIALAKRTILPKPKGKLRATQVRSVSTRPLDE